MAKEKCWKCKKLKNGVKLRSCDDRLCKECNDANESLLRKQRGGVSAAASTTVIAPGKKKTGSTSSSSSRTRKNSCNELFDSDSEEKEPLEETVEKLRNDIAGLHDIIYAMRCEIDELKLKVQPSVPSKVEMPAKQTDSGNATPVTNPDVCTAVHRVLQDADKRKRHVIVSGIIENGNTDDSTTFTTICEEHLHFKPAVASCVRLGKRTTNAPRRLLVRLYREDAAAELLRSARSLRNAEDPVVRDSVYINPDLAPAAAKLAYEERQRRRQRRSAAGGGASVDQQGGRVDMPTVAPVAGRVGASGGLNQLNGLNHTATTGDLIDGKEAAVDDFRRGPGGSGDGVGALTPI